MYIEVKLLILSGMAYLLYRLVKRIALDDIFENAIETEGVITKIIDDEGIYHFYVSFVTEEGRSVVGRSVGYRRIYGDYEKGDRMRIKYNGGLTTDQPRIKLLATDVEKCKVSPMSYKIILTVSLLFLFSAVVLTVMRFI